MKPYGQQPPGWLIGAVIVALALPSSVLTGLAGWWLWRRFLL